MAINTLETSTIFQNTLDKLAVQELTTGWMDANASQVKYSGGAEVKIPQLSTQGLGDYDRDNGYAQRSADFRYKTYTMTQDRGGKFHLDVVDIDETNFVVNASSVLSTFQTEKVVPEIDAYRLSKIATDVISANTGLVEYGYDPTSTATSPLAKLMGAISAIRENGYNGQLVIQATPSFILQFEIEMAGKLSAVEFNKNGVITKVPAIDGIPIIATPQNRMYTAIKILDGKTTGQEVGGYAKAETGKDINFIVIPETVPIAVTKQDNVKIITPEANQNADAWTVMYRRFHDLWVLDNKLNSIYVSVKDAE